MLTSHQYQGYGGQGGQQGYGNYNPYDEATSNPYSQQGRTQAQYSDRPGIQEQGSSYYAGDEEQGGAGRYGEIVDTPVQAFSSLTASRDDQHEWRSRWS